MTMERVFSGLMALFSLFLIYLAIGYVAPIAYDPISPRPYPILILIFSLMAFLTLIITFRPVRFTKIIDLSYDKTVIRNLLLCVFVYLSRRPVHPMEQLYHYRFMGFGAADGVYAHGS